MRCCNQLQQAVQVLFTSMKAAEQLAVTGYSTHYGTALTQVNTALMLFNHVVKHILYFSKHGEYVVGDIDKIPFKKLQFCSVCNKET